MNWPRWRPDRPERSSKCYSTSSNYEQDKKQHSRRCERGAAWIGFASCESDAVPALANEFTVCVSVVVAVTVVAVSVSVSVCVVCCVCVYSVATLALCLCDLSAAVAVVVWLWLCGWRVSRHRWKLRGSERKQSKRSGFANRSRYTNKHTHTQTHTCRTDVCRVHTVCVAGFPCRACAQRSAVCVCASAPTRTKPFDAKETSSG